MAKNKWDHKKYEGGGESDSYANIPPKPVQWLWPNRIAAGKVNLLVGRPGQGKTIFWVDLAARVTTGGFFPDHPDVSYPPGDVIAMSAEDDVADTLRPRFDAAGGDTLRMRDLRIGSLEDNLQCLEAELKDAANPRLVVIDPIAGFLKGVSHRSVRQQLQRLMELADRHPDCAFLLVTHFNKTSGTANVISRVQGSAAYGAVARTIHVLEQHPTEKAKSIFIPLKNNLAPTMAGLSFSKANIDGYPKAIWDQEPVDDVTAAMAVAAAEKAGQMKPIDVAEHFLLRELMDGPMFASDLKVKSEKLGIAYSTLWRAAKRLGVKITGSGATAKWCPPVLDSFDFSDPDDEDGDDDNDDEHGGY